jgi:hypothetical protein
MHFAYCMCKISLIKSFSKIAISGIINEVSKSRNVKIKMNISLLVGLVLSKFSHILHIQYAKCYNSRLSNNI